MKKTAKILLCAAATLLAAYILIFSAANGCSTITSIKDGDTFTQILTAASNDFFGIRNEKYHEIKLALPEHNNYTAIEDKLCYSTLLTDAQKEAYHIIEEGIFRVTDIDCGEFGINRTVAIPISGLSSMEIFMVKEAVLADHPEVFWLNGYYSVEFNMHDGNYIFLYSDYTYSDIQLISRELEQSVAACLRAIPRSLSEYERELLIHDMIIENTVYDTETSDLLMSGTDTFFAGSTASGVLVDGKAICGGYANAFKLLCNRVGISCGLVLGTSKSTGHMWNVVRINGKWYYVDTTWDDPLSSEDSEQNLDSISYVYFNITSEQLAYDHEISPLHTPLTGMTGMQNAGNLYNFHVRKCTDESLSYYAQNAVYIETLDSSGYKALKEALQDVDTDNKIYIVMPGDADSEVAEKWLVQSISRIYGTLRHKFPANHAPALGTYNELSPPQCDGLFYCYIIEK